MSEKVAESMVTHILKDGGKTWRQAAALNGKGKIIYKALKNELKSPVGLTVHSEVFRNAEIIRTVPLTIARRFTNHIAKESLSGRRASDIVEDLLEMYPKITNAQAKCIARTESSKTSSALTKSRAENLGLRCYIWGTSKDSRTRESHKKMDDVICFYSNPPAPELIVNEKYAGRYEPGCIYNCRCIQIPIIDLDDITWPHKVYVNDKIVTMSKKKFIETFGDVS